MSWGSCDCGHHCVNAGPHTSEAHQRPPGPINMRSVCLSESGQGLGLPVCIDPSTLCKSHLNRQSWRLWLDVNVSNQYNIKMMGLKFKSCVLSDILSTYFFLLLKPPSAVHVCNLKSSYLSSPSQLQEMHSFSVTLHQPVDFSCHKVLCWFMVPLDGNDFCVPVLILGLF